MISKIKFRVGFVMGQNCSCDTVIWQSGLLPSEVDSSLQGFHLGGDFEWDSSTSSTVTSHYDFPSIWDSSSTQIKSNQRRMLIPGLQEGKDIFLVGAGGRKVLAGL